MPDAFMGRTRDPRDPAVSVFEIIPDDGADLAHVTTGINVATPGVVRVTTVDGSTADLSMIPGRAFAIRARRVWLSGTTATGIRGLI